MVAEDWAMSRVQVNGGSPAEVKIALFRELFRGREDVYARRFENLKTGKSGYAPACALEWRRGICEKPRVKCSACTHQSFLPLTDQVVRWHLSGRDQQGQPCVIGVYPMLVDETCWFLAIDLDGPNWFADVEALRLACQKHHLPAVVERSRSGDGAHLWLFFQQPIPAVLARNLGSCLLTTAMEGHPQLGLASYDRLFPNQDTLPTGGWGNLIALPLQHAARQRGNSVFIDPRGQAYPDQWDFLSRQPKLSRDRVEAVVQQARSAGRIVGVRAVPWDENEDRPWDPRPLGPLELAAGDRLPKTLTVVLADQIYLEKERLPPVLQNRLLRLAAFQNPDFYRTQALRLPTYGKPRIIACAEVHAKHLALPRGCLDELLTMLKQLGIKVEMDDQRFSGTHLETRFLGQLRPEQQAAARDLLAHDTGVLAATTSFGKTVVAAWLIAQRGVNTLVLVHRRLLLEQWLERLASFLVLPTSTIGRIGSGRRQATGHLDVALIQSLVRRDVVDPQVRHYGHLVFDECHHLSARSFEQLARRSPAKYVTGLSATVTRKDGQHPIVLMQCGPIRHRVDARAAALLRPFEHRVHVRPTDFYYELASEDDERARFARIYQALVADQERTSMICQDVVEAVAEGRCPLVLTERREHLAILVDHLQKRLPGVVARHGAGKSKSGKKSQPPIAKLPRGEPRSSGDSGDGSRIQADSGADRDSSASEVAEPSVLVATGRFLGEGFDEPRLDTLFLTMPISWRGTLAQYVGRLHRCQAGKREVRVYDYADLNVPMLARMFDRRCQGYQALGYTVLLPGSAVPGWPSEVSLPVEPQWKNAYATTVQRLVRDGVDAPLARLFVAATQAVEQAKGGVSRANSASEAFLFRRLETLGQTEGRFQLNAVLPIPFDGRGQMEVDFFCAEAKLVIELDGRQHLEQLDQYRSDRRKDALLQEHGYFVLRFLAQDLAGKLHLVLDTILRVLEHRRQR